MAQLVEIMRNPLAAPILLSLAAGSLAYVLSRLSALTCRAIALLAGAGVLSGGLVIVGKPPGRFSWTWVRLSEKFALTVDLSYTPLGMVVVIAGAAFAMLVTLYSFRAMAGEYWEGKFYSYLIWALAGACIVGLAGNLLVLLVGWELVTLMLFLMINQGRANAKAGAAKTYGVLGFADACLMMAIALLAWTAAPGATSAGPGGSDNWVLGRPPVSAGSMGAAGYAIYALILIAVLAKVGAMPLHTWVPAAAEDAPPPVLAYLPGSLDKLLGVYLLATLVFRIFTPDSVMGAAILVIGCITLLGAGLMAVMQANLNKALSFDAVSQAGYILIGVGGGTWLLASGSADAPQLAGIAIAGGLFHAINHAIYKCSLFLMSGAVTRATGARDMPQMGGLASVMPITFVCGLVAALSASGIPPLNGFASKWLVFEGTLGMRNSGAIAVLIVAVFASTLSLAVFVKILHAVFLSPGPAGSPKAKPQEGAISLTAPMVLLAAACVLLGVWPQLILNHVLAPVIASAGAVPLAQTGAAIQAGPIGLWNPTQATGLILLGLLGGLGLVWISTRKTKVRLARPFLGGEVPGPADDRFRVPGTHFYGTLGRLPGIGPLLKQGQAGAMDFYHWSARHGLTLVELLRRQHTGLIGLYVAWCVIGLTVTLIYLLVGVGR